MRRSNPKMHDKTMTQINDLKERNVHLAKEVAKLRVALHDIVTERNKLHAQNLAMSQQLNNVRKHSTILHTSFMTHTECLTNLLVATNTDYRHVENGSLTRKSSVKAQSAHNSIEEETVVNNSAANSSGENSLNKSGGAEQSKTNKSNTLEQPSISNLSTIAEEDVSEVVSMLRKEVVVQLSPCRTLENRLSARSSKSFSSDISAVDSDKGIPVVRRRSKRSLVETERENDGDESSRGSSKESNFLNSTKVTMRRGGRAVRIPSPEGSPTTSPTETGTPSISSTIANFTDTFERDTEQASSSCASSPVRKSSRSILSPGFSRILERDMTKTSTPINLLKTKDMNTSCKTMMSSPLKGQNVKKMKYNLENVSPVNSPKKSRRQRNAKPASLKEASLRKKLRRPDN